MPGARRSFQLAVLTVALVMGLASVSGARGGDYLFAPYLDMTQYPAPNLGQIARASRARAISLGFVTAAQGRRCAPSWGGYASERASGSRPYRRAALAGLVARGTQLIPSFGGAAGVELAVACPTVTALEQAYGAVIAAYGVHRVDFDVEGATLADRGASDRRARAIAALQEAARRAGQPLQVSFTLPVLPSGLDANGLATVRDVVARGVRIASVNAMTMDYGGTAAPHPRGRMARYAMLAARRVAGQLGGVYPGRSARARMAMVGLTPMIGINDVATEIFTLADARALARWGRHAHVGLLSMWQLERDHPCAGPTRFTQLACSGVSQVSWAFSRALRG